MKTTVISILGLEKDAKGGASEARWNSWRPNIGLVQQENLPIDDLHLIFDEKFNKLAERVRDDIRQVSPNVNVIFDIMNMEDPWDFEEVYGKFYEYSKKAEFHKEDKNYYIHISTGTHVAQICLFLLTESRHFPGMLVQTSPREGHVKGSTDSKGMCNIINLDLSRYDKLAKRFEVELSDDLSFLKQGIETKNKAFNKLIETIERVAIRSLDPILITGPTGAGKSQLAKQIYALKKNKNQISGKFVGVNCATLGGDIANGALFGYKKGAFTGAVSNHDGFLKEADKGILFLDEIGELPLEAQTKLLKAIEEKTFRPLGATEDEESDFQIICGTNRNLEKEVIDKKFRSDLLARINLWSFELPGLADRPEDIEPNLEYEIRRFSEKNNKHITFSKEAREKFLDFALSSDNKWAGNFRDLNAMVVRMATLSDGGRITREIVEEELGRSGSSRLKDGATPLSMAGEELLVRILGEDYQERFDSIDIAQLSHAIVVCRSSDSAADAAKKLFAVTRKAKSSTNDSDRLKKYLARFGLSFREIIRAQG